MKITICGSMAFHREMKNIGGRLQKSGHEVTVPLLLMGDKKMGGIDSLRPDDPIWQEKSAAIDDHFEKVAWSDAILIANYPKHGIEGYIGGNSLMEMAVARFLKKKIYLLFKASSQLLYKEEILGLQPVIINEDLDLIV